ERTAIRLDAVADRLDPVDVGKVLHRAAGAAGQVRRLHIEAARIVDDHLTGAVAAMALGAAARIVEIVATFEARRVGRDGYRLDVDGHDPRELVFATKLCKRHRAAGDDEQENDKAGYDLQKLPHARLSKKKSAEASQAKRLCL